MWLARLHADDCSDVDRQRFSAWLDDDQANRRAFEVATTAFDAAGAVTDVWGGRGYPDASPVEEPSGARPATRRAVLAGAGVLALGGGAIGWQAAFAGSVRTGFAERRTLRLGDGSIAQLDAETSVREPWLRPRTLELGRGRISLQAVKRPGNDFAVIAPRHRIAGNGIDADLSLDGDRLTILLLRGEALVTPDDAPAIRLRAGERLAPDGAIDRPALEQLSAWRQGRLTFAGTRLADACAQLNRYDAMRLVPEGDTGALQISGTFAMGRNSDFARAMTELLPIRADRHDGRIDLVMVGGNSPPG